MDCADHRHHSRVFRRQAKSTAPRRASAGTLRTFASHARAFQSLLPGLRAPPRYSLVARVRPGRAGLASLYRRPTLQRVCARCLRQHRHDGSSSVALAAAYHSLLAIADFRAECADARLAVSVRKIHTSHRTELRTGRRRMLSANAYERIYGECVLWISKYGRL